MTWWQHPIVRIVDVSFPQRQIEVVDSSLGGTFHSIIDVVISEGLSRRDFLPDGSERPQDKYDSEDGEEAWDDFNHVYLGIEEAEELIVGLQKAIAIMKEAPKNKTPSEA